MAHLATLACFTRLSLAKQSHLTANGLAFLRDATRLEIL